MTASARSSQRATASWCRRGSAECGKSWRAVANCMPSSSARRPRAERARLMDQPRRWEYVCGVFGPEGRYGAVHYRRCLAALMGVLLMLTGRAGSAHHSVGGEFNEHKLIQLKGVVSEVDWANPHVYLRFVVKEPNGSTTSWRLASVPTAMMRKAGLSKALLLGGGQSAVVDAYPARDGTPNFAYLVRITYADGHHFQFAPVAPGPTS